MSGTDHDILIGIAEQIAADYPASAQLLRGIACDVARMQELLDVIVEDARRDAAFRPVGAIIEPIVERAAR